MLFCEVRAYEVAEERAMIAHLEVDELVDDCLGTALRRLAEQTRIEG
jgi:hypothetical protein